MLCVALLSLMRRDVTVGSCGNDTTKPSASARNSRHWFWAEAGTNWRASIKRANANWRMKIPRGTCSVLRSVTDINQRAAVHGQLHTRNEIRLVGSEEERRIRDVPGRA